MKRKKVKILIFFILILSITLISACTQSKDNDINNDDVVAPTNPDQDVNLTEKLLAEEEVLDGQIYIRDDWAIGAITLKDDTTEQRAQEMAQQYAEEIKEKYRDKKVNVQVILNKENVANIVL